MRRDLDPGTVARLCASLAAMGLLGFDLRENQYFYRRLPFKTSRILQLNPRLKNARALLENADDVQLVAVGPGGRTEARVRGIEVPQQLAVMGGGDAEFAASLSPSLTSIRIDGRETGRQAGEMLVARLQQRPLPQSRIDIGFELMAREST